MDPDSSYLIFYLLLIIVLLIGGAYFAMCETAFASVNEIRLISYADDGNRNAKIAVKIKDDFEKALTTILVGNNIMHISTSSVATLMANKMWGDSVLTIVTFVTTFVVFLFAEMIPKAYAKDCNEKMSLLLAPSLYFFMVVLTPITAIFMFLSNLISKISGSKVEDDPTISEEELFDIIENIDNEDKIDDDEAELVKSALEFTIKKAKEIYIPWQSVAKLKTNMSIKQIDDIVLNSNYTRLPVLDDDDNLIGILQIRTYLKDKLNKKRINLKKIKLDDIYYVNDNKPIDEIIDYLSLHKAHMAFVKNRKDKILGILTIEDVLEELVGEIYDEEEKERVRL